jgi:hypothetical protein
MLRLHPKIFRAYDIAQSSGRQVGMLKRPHPRLPVEAVGHKS